MNPNAKPPPLSLEDLQNILPHRLPFLLIEGVVEADAEHVVATRTLRESDFFFQGHFPGNPILPGVIQVEMMAQTGLVLYHYNNPIEKLFFLGKEKSRFFHPVRPGAELRITARKMKMLKNMGLVSAEIHVNGTKVSESEQVFAGGA
ncbi:MAG: beta-hydroxyacyl-ACP dehydratase [Verrucomicrobiae bacterium]|nr:beta-hydroxyacyl-ACP dehydratase [Verrucomicrobiae bacterium]